MKARALLVVAGLVTLIAGCATTSVTRVDSGTTYSPTEHVELLFDQPDRPYTTIAVLESRGPIGLGLPELLEDMKEKAKAVGADAVIPIQDASQQQAPGLIYNPWLGGYQTIGGGTIPGVRGIAIKYQQ